MGVVKSSIGAGTIGRYYRGEKKTMFQIERLTRTSHVTIFHALLFVSYNAAMPAMSPYIISLLLTVVLAMCMLFYMSTVEKTIYGMTKLRSVDDSLVGKLNINFPLEYFGLFCSVIAYAHTSPETPHYVLVSFGIFALHAYNQYRNGQTAQATADFVNL